MPDVVSVESRNKHNPQLFRCMGCPQLTKQTLEIGSVEGTQMEANDGQYLVVYGHEKVRMHSVLSVSDSVCSLSI